MGLKLHQVMKRVRHKGMKRSTAKEVNGVVCCDIVLLDHFLLGKELCTGIDKQEEAHRKFVNYNASRAFKV